MTRLAAIAVALVAIPSVASAGTYLGLGIGTAAGGSWESSSYNGDIDGFERSGRLLVGYRISKFSVEGQVSRFALTFGDPLEFRGHQAGVAAKFNFPLGNNFEVYPKAGVARTWLSGMNGPDSYAGNGWFLGAGAEYRLNLGVTAASLFVDYQRTSTSFDSDPMDTIDGAIGMWTLGGLPAA
jgi:hypothetical protein